MGFAADNEIGGRGEAFISSLIALSHGQVTKMEGFFKPWDLQAEDGYTAEVKYDVISRETGNIGIEMFCKNKPSGILTCGADDWYHIYKLGSDWVYSQVCVDMLKHFVYWTGDLHKQVKGGDNDESVILLIPAELFARRFGCTRIDK